MDQRTKNDSGNSAPTTGNTSEASSQFITFKLDEAEYGVDIMMVREIKGWSQTTSIPNAPHFIPGVINLRGIIVPIMDLRARLSMGATLPTKMHVVIIISTGNRTTGLLVDAVSDIIAVRPDHIRPIPSLGATMTENLLTGLVALEDRMVSLVSLEGLINYGDTAGVPSADAVMRAAA